MFVFVCALGKCTMGTTLVIITVIFTLVAFFLLIYGFAYYSKTPPPAVTPNSDVPPRKKKEKKIKPPPVPMEEEYDMVSIESDSELRLPDPVDMEEVEVPPPTKEELEEFKINMEKALMQREIEYLRKELIVHKNKEQFAVADV